MCACFNQEVFIDLKRSPFTVYTYLDVFNIKCPKLIIKKTFASHFFDK